MKKMLEIYSDRDKECLVALSVDLTQLRMKINEVDRPIESPELKNKEKKKKKVKETSETVSKGASYT